jgi:Bacteriophage tail sheath protein
MPRPGVDVSLLDTPGAAISVPTDTGVWFTVGLTERGPTNEALAVLSIDDFTAKYGNRVSYSSFYDCMEEFFKEGGYQAYVGRVVGPAAASGSLNLLDSTSAISLVASARGAGSWSANVRIAVLTGTVGGTFVIQVQDAVGNILEDSGNLVDQSEAVAWSQGSDYIRLTLGASANDPAVLAPTPMSAGADDRVNITDTEWQKALDLFPEDLGPGQVSAPGRTTSAGHTQLINHATDKTRVAVLDLTDSPSVSTLTTAAGTGRFCASFAPWLTIPGLAAGSTRTIPPSALISGLCARNDAALGPNRPAAGDAGVSRYSIGLSQPSWSDADRQTLNTGKVNVIRNIYGSIVNYGFRSGANPNTDKNWIDFANARLYMSLSAELNQAAQAYMFEEIDGQNGHTINGFHDSLAGVMLHHYNMGELFGDSPETAFNVDTGPSVNTLERLQNLELHAVVYVSMAPFAEYIVIQIVKRALV